MNLEEFGLLPRRKSRRKSHLYRSGFLETMGVALRDGDPGVEWSVLTELSILPSRLIAWPFIAFFRKDLALIPLGLTTMISYPCMSVSDLS